MDKKQGITHQIRLRLSTGAFADDRLWKRFSARRLELIDTLDLSLKKALEQEVEIKKVAELLRQEFEYGVEYTADFDKLVRAAVQLVRRNRKRLLKLKKVETKKFKQDETFISEIARLRDSGAGDMVDLLYLRSRTHSLVDHASATIDQMLAQPKLPLITQLDIQDTPDFEAAITKCRLVLINQIERLKLCAELVTKKLANLQILGLLVVAACIAYVFEKLFDQVNPNLVEYLRGKLENPRHLAEFFRLLDPNTPQITDEVAVISLYMLLGGCVKDFGFTATMMPLAKMFFFCIMRDYPFFAKVATDFEYFEVRIKEDVVDKEESLLASPVKVQPAQAPVPTLPPITPSLASLAEVSTRVLPIPSAISSGTHTPIQTPRVQSPIQVDKKKVLLKFLDKVLEFSYPIRNSAPPRYAELVENARLAFHLAQNSPLGLRDPRSQEHLQTDGDLERVFLHQEVIEIEVLTMGSNAIPAYELALTVTGRSSGGKGTELPRYLLPPIRPPVDQFQPLL